MSSNTDSNNKKAEKDDKSMRLPHAVDKDMVDINGVIGKKQCPTCLIYRAIYGGMLLSPAGKQVKVLLLLCAQV